MKVTALSLIAGLGGTLIAPAGALAGFTGLKVVGKTIPPGVPGLPGGFVCNVFATFNRPPSGGFVHDRFLAGAGTPDSPLDIHVVGGTFYQHPQGDFTGGPPSAALVQALPALAFDSFVTVGIKKFGPPDGQPAVPLTFTNGFPRFGPGPLGGINVAWAVTPADPNSDPFNPNYVNGNGQVLIGQFTTLNGTGIVGMMRIVIIDNDVLTNISVSFAHFIPAPGALALLAMCGLIGLRRRRI